MARDSDRLLSDTQLQDAIGLTRFDAYLHPEAQKRDSCKARLKELQEEAQRRRQVATGTCKIA